MAALRVERRTLCGLSMAPQAHRRAVAEGHRFAGLLDAPGATAGMRGDAVEAAVARNYSDLIDSMDTEPRD